MNKVLISILIIVSPFLANCQFSESANLDVGSNTISSGPFFRFSSLSQYTWNKLHGLAGFQYSLSNADRKNLSGLKIAIGREFEIKNFPIVADLFFLQNPYSELSKESNFGFLLMHQRRRIAIDLGYHMRKYTLKSTEEETADLPPGADLSIWEYRNFIYRGTLYLNKQDKDWNLSLSATNYDLFLIQQETNPMFNLAAYYNISKALKVNMELWYQGAGMLNLHPNHYGYYFRTGIVWSIGN